MGGVFWRSESLRGGLKTLLASIWAFTDIFFGAFCEARIYILERRP